MDNEYYILDKGERIGPFTPRELMDRPLEPADVVLSGSQTQGVPAFSLPEFTEYFKSEGIYFPTKQNTSGYWLRVPAFIIDIIILVFGISILGGVFFGPYMEQYAKIFTPAALTDPEQAKVIFQQHQTAIMVMQLIVVLVIFVYNSACEATRLRGSLGKYMLGLAVVDNMGYSLTINQAMIRNIGKLSYEIPGFVLGIFAYLLNVAIIWNPMHQALHDRISGCFVVQKSK